MVATDVKQIRSRYIHDFSVGRFASAARLRSQHSGSEEVFVTNAFQSAEFFERLGVNLANEFHAQMKAIVRRSAHASLRNVFR